MPAGRPRIKHEPDIMTTSMVAAQLAITSQRIQKLIKEGVLTAYVFDPQEGFHVKQKEDKRHGQTLYFYTSDIQAYAATRASVGRPETPPKDKTSAYNKEYYRQHKKAEREREKQEKAIS